MEKSRYNEPPQFVPLLISIAIHTILLLLILLISYRHYHYLKKKSFQEAAYDVLIESVVISQENENWQTEPGLDAQRLFQRGGPGPYGLNDEAGRELVEYARKGISITPDNFIEYAKLRSLRRDLRKDPRKDPRKDLNSNPLEKIDGRVSFSTGIDHKFKSDFQEYYENVCRIIDFPQSRQLSTDDESNDFTAAVLGYLNGGRAVRTWRTLWMVRKPATTEDKIELVRLLRRLHLYHVEGEDAGYEHMRESLKSIISIIPDDLKYPALRNK